MNTESRDMRRVERDWSFWDPGARPLIGDFTIYDHSYTTAETGELVTVKMISMMLPGDSVCTIPLAPVPPAAKGFGNNAGWQWDGNMDKPTLSPSVFFMANKPEHPKAWHRFPREGRMVSC